jgi:hypothetical protein
MGRKKTVKRSDPVFEDAPKKSLKDRKVVVTQGSWEVFKDGVGFTKAKFRATFVDDPEGTTGYGTTKEAATANLFAYESL